MKGLLDPPQKDHDPHTENHCNTLLSECISLDFNKCSPGKLVLFAWVDFVPSLLQKEENLEVGPEKMK